MGCRLTRTTLRACLPGMLIAAACSADVPASERTETASARAAHVLSWTGPDGDLHEAVLAGVLGPHPEFHRSEAAAAQDALEARLAEADGRIGLDPAGGGDEDRYGRRITMARTGGPGGALLQEMLVEEGWLMVWPRAGQTLDFSSMLELEAHARAGRRGAWRSGAFAVRDPDPDRLAQHLDSAQIVEGRVIATGEGRGGRVYLNFGLDWRTDFTVSASRAVRREFEAAGVVLESLDGAVIRVRGWLYEENGPMISLSHPAQLEILDAPEPRRLR